MKSHDKCVSSKISLWNDAEPCIDLTTWTTLVESTHYVIKKDREMLLDLTTCMTLFYFTLCNDAAPCIVLKTWTTLFD